MHHQVIGSVVFQDNDSVYIRAEMYHRVLLQGLRSISLCVSVPIIVYQYPILTMLSCLCKINIWQHSDLHENVYIFPLFSVMVLWTVYIQSQFLRLCPCTKCMGVSVPLLYIIHRKFMHLWGFVTHWTLLWVYTSCRRAQPKTNLSQGGVYSQ